MVARHYETIVLAQYAFTFMLAPSPDFRRFCPLSKATVYEEPELYQGGELIIRHLLNGFIQGRFRPAKGSGDRMADARAVAAIA